jgi:hypothetical protein
MPRPPDGASDEIGSWLQGTEFGKADAAKFGEALAEIAEAEGVIRLLGIESGEKPCGSALWAE